MARRFAFSRRRAGLVAALVMLIAGSVPAAAHVLNMTRVILTVTPQHELAIQIDADLSLMLGDYKTYTEILLLPPVQQEPRLSELGRQFIDVIELKLDGQKIVLRPTDWTLPDSPPDKIGDQSVASMTSFHYRYPLPPTAHALTLSPATMAKIEFPLAYTFSVPWQDLLMTRWIELPGGVSRSLIVPEEFPSADSAVATTVTPVEAPAPDSRAAAPLVSAPPAVFLQPPAVKVKAATGPSVAEFTPGELQVARFVSTVMQYLRLGFRHIFPHGMDHMLFVLGLFFLSARWRPLLSQTTAFTVAHTTTLGLSAYGLISLSPRIVEPLVALSITYVALENIFKPQLNPTRIVIVFFFGLLHGLGFAGSLKEVPMPRDQFFTALFSFNIGVDAGQLTVLAIAFLAVGSFRNQPWYRQRIVVPACAIIATIGAYWTVTRIFT